MLVLKQFGPLEFVKQLYKDVNHPSALRKGQSSEVGPKRREEKRNFGQDRRNLSKHMMQTTKKEKHIKERAQIIVTTFHTAEIFITVKRNERGMLLQTTFLETSTKRILTKCPLMKFRVMPVKFRYLRKVLLHATNFHYYCRSYYRAHDRA